MQARTSKQITFEPTSPERISNLLPALGYVDLGREAPWIVEFVHENLTELQYISKMSHYQGRIIL